MSLRGQLKHSRAVRCVRGHRAVIDPRPRTVDDPLSTVRAPWRNEMRGIPEPTVDAPWQTLRARVSEMHRWLIERARTRWVRACVGAAGVVGTAFLIGQSALAPPTHSRASWLLLLLAPRVVAGADVGSGSIDLNLTPSSQSVSQGYATSTIATLTRSGGYTGTVSLSAEALPSGVTASFTPSSLSGGTLTSMVSLTASGGATLGGASVVIRASGSGVTDVTATLTLTVLAPGSFEHLRPRLYDGTPLIPSTSTAHGPGYSYNPDDGDWWGRAVDTTEPEYTHIVDFTSHGSDYAANYTEMVDLVATLVAGPAQTEHCLVRVPYTAQLGGNEWQLPAGLSDYRIGFHSTGLSYLPEPSPGDGATKSNYTNQVNPADHAAYMVKVRKVPGVNDGGFLLTTAVGAKNYTFRGFLCDNPDAALCGSALYIAANKDVNDTNLAHYPSSIHFIQCGVDGGPVQHFGVSGFFRAGIFAGTGIAFVDGFIKRIGFDGNLSGAIVPQCQGFWMPWVRGPYEIFNNDIEATGEMTFTGGSSYPFSNTADLAGNVAIVQNFFHNSIAGTDSAQNAFEAKLGDGILLHGNRIEIAEGDVNHRGGIELKTTDQGGTSPHPVTQNAAITANYIPYGKGGIAVTGTESGVNLVKGTNRVAVINNICLPDRAPGYAFVLSSSAHADSDLRTDNIHFLYNTGRIDDEGYHGAFYTLNGDGNKFTHCTIKHNVAVLPDSTQVLLNCGFGGVNETGWAYNSAYSVLENNLSNSYPSYVDNQITVSSIAALKLHNNALRQMWLDSDSPGHAADGSGRDLGYCKPVFDAIQARLRPMV